jgi:hypothetical protein
MDILFGVFTVTKAHSACLNLARRRAITKRNQKSLDVTESAPSGWIPPTPVTVSGIWSQAR